MPDTPENVNVDYNLVEDFDNDVAFLAGDVTVNTLKNEDIDTIMDFNSELKSLYGKNSDFKTSLTSSVSTFATNIRTVAKGFTHVDEVATDELGG